VNQDHLPDRGAPVESDVKSRCGNPRGGARRTNDGGDGRRRRPQHGKKAHPALASDGGGGNRLPVRHIDHQRDGAAIGEEDMLNLVTRLCEDRVLTECHLFQFGRQQIEVRARKCCQKAVTSSVGTRHCT
jgi:hypothetical protein